MAYIKSQQILVPRQIYIGDSGELRANFETDSVLFRNLVAQKGNIELSQNYFTQQIDETSFEIKSVVISSSGYNNYALTVSFIPWKTGDLTLPPFDIGAALNSDAEIYVMGFQACSVTSITKTESLNTLRDFQPPLLLPGTTYKIYALIIVLLLFIALICRLIAKRKSLLFFIKNEILLWKYRKNRRSAFKKLYNLEKNKNLTDAQIAASIQKVVREYLEFRFDYPFTKLVSSEIMQGFNQATSNLMSDKKSDAAQEIVRVFVRTDYIRYKANGVFEANEKQQLISLLMQNIDILEQKEEENA